MEEEMNEYVEDFLEESRLEDLVLASLSYESIR
jgi:hypothetical protein